MLQPSRCGEGGHAAQRWLGGAEATWSHLPGPRSQVAHVLQPSRQVWRGGQVAWRGAKPPGATRAVTWPQAAFGIYSRCFLHCFAHVHRRRKPSAPGAFWTVLLMEQVAEATCILCKKLQRTRGGTWRFPRVSRAKSGILWLSGVTTRVRWRGASYLGPSMVSVSSSPVSLLFFLLFLYVLSLSSCMLCTSRRLLFA